MELRKERALRPGPMDLAATDFSTSTGVPE